MKRTFYLFYLLAAAALVLIATTKTQAAPVTLELDASVDYFYSSLSPHGEWIEIDAGYYGWRPARVLAGWRPYLYGRWAWTDHGWYWMSSEPFGWAVYHYGRWFYDDYYGWVWIPDRTWGPAWVEWRYNDDYIGWAPLPPYASFSFSIGIRFTTRWFAPYRYWSFVRYRHFGHHSIDRYCSPPEYAQRLIGTTRISSRYEIDRDRVINRGVDRTYIERQGRTRIERFDVTNTRDRNGGSERITRDSGGRERIEIYRPDTDPTVERNVRVEARRPERRLSLEFNRIERGTPERPTETRTGVGRENRTRNDEEIRTPERDDNRETDRRPEQGRERRIETNVRPSLPESRSSERRDVQQTKPRSRENFLAPFFERKEMTRERIERRESVSPPRMERESKPAPQSRQRESAPSGGSRSSGAKRNRK